LPDSSPQPLKSLASCRLEGRVTVPGDKSISHRSLMFGALALGETVITGLLEGEDVLNTAKAMAAMGARVERWNDDNSWHVTGVGLGGFQAPAQTIDFGNSGTGARLVMGLIATTPITARMSGDASLRSRPMGRIVTPLEKFGARFETAEGGRMPLTVHGAANPVPIEYRLPVASAQVKSAVLLAGLNAPGETTVIEPEATRDHTEKMLPAFGVELAGDRAVDGGSRLRGATLDVPGDISSAAFFLVGASIAPGSDLVLEHVGVNPTRTGVLEILRLMGADIQVTNARDVGGEPVADLRVRAAPLRGIRIPEAQVPLAIDEFPALFVAAACADGETVLTGAEELRVKESDRIQVMADGLQALGADARPTPDGIVIRGGALGGGRIDSHGDHRIAMAFAMAALRAGGDIAIDDCANVNTSFPGFATLAGGAGLAIEVEG